MSWLAKSIADTLSLNDDADAGDAAVSPATNHPTTTTTTTTTTTNNPEQPSPRGVKEDLSEITQTLTRQFWGVASFLAPPPQSEPYKPLESDQDPVESPGGDRSVSGTGIRSDLSEIGGRFRTGFSKVAGNIKVKEITKMATDFIQKAVEEMNEEAARGVLGVSEEVVAFAKDLAQHPETWLDFPLIQDEDGMEEEFDMSDAQQEHALAVERLAPSLAALRMELCPEHISDSCFWKIYFVLLHPKLDKEVAVILSTSQVMEARALLTTELQNHPRVKQDSNLITTSIDQKDSSSFQDEVTLSVPSDVPENATQNVVVSRPDVSTKTPDHEVEKHPPTSIDIQVVEKSATSTTTADSQTDKHPVTDSQTDKHPVTDSQTDKHLVTDSQTDKHSIADAQTDKHSIADAQTDKHSIADAQTDKHSIGPSESQVVDKSVIEVEHNDRKKDQIVEAGPSNAWDSREDEDDDDGDDWLKEETSELGGGASQTTIPIDEDEDVSFSDLEDDDVDAPSTLKKVNDTSDKDSRDWVQL